MSVYYNEIDPFAAAWLRELMADNLIAPGEIDTRSIEDVRPQDLAGFAQCHFFAGIGIWSLALRINGVPDDAPVWTGSCPCQPFSAAGKGSGFADERHLWPAFHYLIEQCRPQLVLGEQVASKDGLGWLDLVQADLEATGYAGGAVDTSAAGFGAPHIRQRLYWMAHAPSSGQSRESGCGGAQDQRIAECSGFGGMADAGCSVLQHQQRFGNDTGAARPAEGEAWELERGRFGDCDGRAAGGMDDTPGARHIPSGGGKPREIEANGGVGWSVSSVGCGVDFERPGPTNGFWRDADWLGCTDGKWRPVEPGTFPLADAGAFRNRVGLLRGAGNAINLAQAAGFVEAALSVLAGDVT